jgi:predicted RND superfamily exporter protein
MITARWFWFALAMLLLAVAWPISQRLSLDRSLERMFPVDDPDRIEFQKIEDEFGVSQFLVFAYRDPQLWAADGSGIDRAMQWRRSIEQTPGVAYALDLSRVDQMLTTLKGPAGLLGAFSAEKASRPLLDTNNKLAKEYRELFTGQTHSAQTDLVAIGVLLDRSQTGLADLRQLVNSAPGGLLVGHVAMVDEGFQEIEQDGNRLGIFSTITLSLLMLLGFRSIRWALIVVVVVQWSLVITRAILVLLDWELTMVSSMLSSIVMVVGVATTLHWMFGYQHFYQSNADETNLELRATGALRASISRLWQPMVWAVITDAIGFASLALSRVGPVQDYGSMMAVACGVVLVGIFCLVPTLALLPMGYQLGNVPGDVWIQKNLQRLLDGVCKHRRWVIAMAGLLLLLGVAGSSRLKVETDFLKNFQSNSPIAQAYRAVETELGGAGIWDVMLPAPKPITQEYFDRVLAMEKELLEIEVPASGPGSQSLRLTSALSLADTDRVARNAPVLKMIPIEARLLGMKQSMGRFFETLLSESQNGRSLRVMLRSQERSESEQKMELISRVRQVVAKHQADMIPDGISNAGQVTAVTGYYVLLTKLVEHVVADQWKSFLVAALGIGISMAIALRSWKYAMVAMIPAVLPSLVVLGVLGGLGIRMNLGAAMIAAVSMGLGVDSSLHYLFRYRQERIGGRGVSVQEGLMAAQNQTGMAVLMATLALVIGFGSMAVSDFLPTVAFGTLAAWTMVGGLIGTLCLLPALVYWVEGDGG